MSKPTQRQLKGDISKLLNKKGLIIDKVQVEKEVYLIASNVLELPTRTLDTGRRVLRVEYREPVE